MANSSHFSSVGELQGPGGRGNFLSALREPLADGSAADIVFATLVETRLNLKDWCQEYTEKHKGSPLDSLVVQSARRECSKSTKSRVRGWFEGLAASYNGNLKSMLAFGSARCMEDPHGALFGRLIEARVAGIPVPNPKKAFMGRSIVESKDGSGIRLCFAGAHFPVAKVAAALEDKGIDQLHGAKVALARSLRKVLRKASRRGVADRRTILFLQGDLNSRTVLGNEIAESECLVSLDRSRDRKLGMELDDSDAICYSGGSALLITGIRGGLAEAWNVEHPQDQMRVGDYIVEVNGIRDDCARMIDECKQSGLLNMRVHRKVTDVLLEVLHDDDLQEAIQHELGLPPGRWHEMVDYEVVHDLPVTYKFLDQVACTSSPAPSPVSSPVARKHGVNPNLISLTIGDIMGAGAGTAARRGVTHQSLELEPDSPASKRKSDDEASSWGLELYKRHMLDIGDEKLAAFGLVYKKNDFRAFRFPACADRIVFWAPDAVADRMSFSLPRGGYEVNHAQLGSDHRPVALEAVLHISPEGSAVRRSKRLQTTVKLEPGALLEQSDDEQGRDSDEGEHSSGEETPSSRIPSGTALLAFSEGGYPR